MTESSWWGMGTTTTNPLKYVGHVLGNCWSISDEVQTSGGALGPHMHRNEVKDVEAEMIPGQ